MNEKIYIENPTKELYNTMKWLKNNSSTDKARITLNGFHIRDNGLLVESSNGIGLVFARLVNPLSMYHENLTDGIWFVDTCTKKLIVLQEIQGSFPDTNAIITVYENTKDRFVESVVSFKPEFILPIISGFDHVNFNIISDASPIQIVLRDDPMDKKFLDGTYIAVLMPRKNRDDNVSFVYIQNQFAEIKL